MNILDHVCFQMKQGEKVAVVGPSGSGKTTFLHTLCGIDRPDFGIIQIQDEELSEMSDDALSLFRRKYFGMIFQDFQLLESLNVKENILLPLILAGRGEGEQKRCLQQVTSAVGIEKLLDKGITEISGGQKQRVAIARAFIHRPALIFADEPTGSVVLVQHYPKEMPVMRFSLSMRISDIADRHSVRFSSRVSVS